MPDTFDCADSEYDRALDQGLSLSGEHREYFAQGRVSFVGECLALLGARPIRALDFGCGAGETAPILRRTLSVDVTGVDVSSTLLDAARLTSHEGVRFAAREDLAPDGSFDLAYCNGVFHHIPLAERAAAVAYVRDSLRPGGVFAFWENNPWNPGTRLVMRRIPFDRDAILVWPAQARRMLKAGGFEILRTDFLFLFPHALRALRGLERPLSQLPLGGQYQVLARRPVDV
jgi:SAM-dependent methyltransferase